MKQVVFVLFCLPMNLIGQAKEIKQVSSPDERIKVVIEINKTVSYTVQYNNQVIVTPSIVNLLIEGFLKSDSSLDFQKANSRTNHSFIISPIPEKRKNIPDNYNELTILFR